MSYTANSLAPQFAWADPPALFDPSCQTIQIGTKGVGAASIHEVRSPL